MDGGRGGGGGADRRVELSRAGGGLKTGGSGLVGNRGPRPFIMGGGGAFLCDCGGGGGGGGGGADDGVCTRSGGGADDGGGGGGGGAAFGIASAEFARRFGDTAGDLPIRGGGGGGGGGGLGLGGLSFALLAAAVLRSSIMLEAGLNDKFSDTLRGMDGAAPLGLLGPVIDG